MTLEALASGVPVIAYDYAAAHEHLPDGGAGCRVPPGDADAFVAAALDWAEHLRENGRERTRQDARAAVEGLSPAEVSARFAQILGSLTQRSAA